MQVLDASPELVAASVRVREELLAPNGYLHAATVVALGDTACGLGARLVLAADAQSSGEGRAPLTYTTSGLTASFTGAARGGQVTVRARPVHLGRRSQVWDAVVADQNDRAMAHIRCTQLVLHPLDS